MEIVGFLVGVVFFIILEGFFAGSEIALVSVDRNRVLSYYKRLSYKFLLDFYQHPEDYITLTMLGYTISIVLASTFYTLAVMSLVPYLPFLEGLEVLFSLSLVAFTLVLGEVIPKSLFQRHAEKLLIPSLWILEKIKTLVHPLLKIVRLISRLMTDRLRNRFLESLTLKDALQIVKELGNANYEMVHNALSLKEKRLSEVFRPLYQVVMVSEDTTVYNALKRMKESKYTKLPVYRARVDEIVGYVDMFDIMDKPDLEKVKNYARQVLVFPEFATVRSALKTFSSSGEKMGIVVDEKGIVLGIITLDDLIREVVGYIGDEQVESSEEVKEIEKDRWVMSAQVSKDEVETYTGVKLPDGPYSTLGGFILYLLGRVPAKGETLEYSNLRFKILQGDHRKVVKLMVEKHVHGEGL